jgi:hypothetical protein
MAAFLKLALLLSGGVSIVVLAVPDLIVIGYIFLILPGVILSLMPTVFFYLALFSATWFGLRGRGEALASAAGVVAVGLVGVGLPQYFNLQTAQWLVEAEARDLVPEGKIGGPLGLIVIEKPKNALGRRDCDELCQLLLYNDVAKKVMVRSLEEEPVVKKSKNSGPMVYWIARENCMVDAELMRGLKESRGYSWSSSGAEEVARAVRVRIAGEECLMGEEAEAARGDLRIRWVDETLGKMESALRLWPGVPWMKGVELRVGDRVVARETVRGAAPLRVPLFLDPISSGMGFRGWRWGRKSDYFDERKLERLAMLKRLTTLDLAPLRGLDETSVRRRLDGALNEPGGSNAAFALVGDYYKLVREEGFEVGDRERLARLILDARVVDFSYFNWSEKQRTGVGERIRNAMLQRMLSEQVLEKRPVTQQLDTLVGRLSKGTFAGAVPLMDELLANGKTRRWYPNVVKRLVDQGKPGGEKLVRIVEEAWGLPDEGLGWGKDAEAATEGLCQLGGEVREFLPRLRAVDRRFAEKVGYLRGHAWRGMLVGLGMEPGEFKSPIQDAARYAADLRKVAERCRVGKGS